VWIDTLMGGKSTGKEREEEFGKFRNKTSIRSDEEKDHQRRSRQRKPDREGPLATSPLGKRSPK